MSVFIALFIYLLLIKFFINSRNRKATCVLAGFGLWVVLALRSPYCGIDLVSGASGSANYYNMFEKAMDASISQILNGDLTRISNMERGWLLYCKFVSLFSSQFQVFLAITALVQLGLIGFVFYKYSNDIILSYIVYFCFGLYIISFSGIRQSTAFSITFLSFHYLLRKKYVKFLLIVLLATFIHNSALFFLLVLPINNIRFTPAKTRMAILCIFLLVPYLSVIIKIIVPFLFGNRYQNYEDSGGAITLFLLYTLICSVSLKIKLQNTRDNLIRGLIIIAVACQSLGYISTGAITRITFYYSIFFSLLFPDLIISYSNNRTRSVLSLFISLLLLEFFYLTNRDGYLNVIPYSFFWERILL